MQLQSSTTHPPPTSSSATRTTVPVFIAVLIFSLLFIISTTTTTTTSSFYAPSLSSWTSSFSPSSRPDPSLFPSRRTRRVIFPTSPSNPPPPSVAFFISGSAGESAPILRLLLASYHPNNYYLLHLDGAASQAERDGLALSVQSVPVFAAAQNVFVMGKPDFAYFAGSSAISAVLHGASVLLRLSDRWDWFVNLSAGDYPLVTQDDLLHILSFMPKEMNFVNHSSYIGWRESRKLKPIIVDPGLYLSEKSVIFFASQKRKLPNAFRLFSGLTSAILSRKVMEFCILATDNFPRTLLMYLANTPSSFSNYFPTVLCNSREFNKTIVNDNLQYAIYERLPQTKPHELSSKDYEDMIRSGAIFASRFLVDDPVLDRIDKEVLNRSPGKTVPGGWCLGESENDTCSSWGDADVLRPGTGARRLEKHIVDLLSNGSFQAQQCIVE